VSGYSEKATAYIEGVSNGSIPACLWIKLAIERTKKDLARQNSPDFPFYFDEEQASIACTFIERLPHIQGSKGGQNICLEPWQRWVVESIFGWCRTGTKHRRFRQVLLELPRGNGKTLLAAACALYTTFAQGEPGADSIATATVESQAKLLLDTARAMCQHSKKLCEKLGLKVEVKKIEQKRTDSRLRAAPGKGATLEGASLHMGVVDELWAHKGRSVVDSLSHATSKRKASLLFLITTAGQDVTGVCFETHEFMLRILEGTATDESFFGAIYTYTGDADVPWDSPLAYKMANPNLNISVEESVVEEMLHRAKQIPSRQAEYRAKILDEWVLNGGQENFLDLNRIRKCYDAALNSAPFAGQPATVGCDFSSRVDFSSVYRVHTRLIDKKLHAYVFGRNWLPELKYREYCSKVAALPGYKSRGEIILSDGDIIDQDALEEYLYTEVWEEHNIRDVSFDPTQSSMLISHLMKRTGKKDAFVELAQTAQKLTPGVRLLEELILDGRLHTSDTCLLWALGNLRVKHFGMNWLQPCRPENNREQKIDPAAALIMALRSIAMVPLEESSVKHEYRVHAW
jgi:phage terminase large subunit-like protein